MNRNVEEMQQDVADAVKDQQTLVPYKGISKCQSMGSFTPISLASQTVEALSRVERAFGDIPQYLAKELGYSSRIAVCDRFSSEQADAIASIIYQFEDKNAFILADMAGIGKGRVCASIVRYAYQKKKIPVFITLNTNLFSDIYRDILDIGGLKSDGATNFYGHPLILNGYKKGDKNSIIQGGQVVVEPPKQSVVKKIINKSVFPEGYDWMMCTYSQFQGKKASAGRRAWLEGIAENCIFILDESHYISGDSDIGDYFEVLVKASDNTLFSSATFAKRPESMYIFSSRTDLGKSDLGVRGLLEAIKSGGNKLQEYMASTLVRSGQMIRRERSFDNCNVVYKYMPEDQTNWSYEKYDEAVSRFTQLAEYCSTQAFSSAGKNAVNRFVEQHNASRGEDYDIHGKIEIVHTPIPTIQAERDEWIADNKGKYVYKYPVGVNIRELFIFIETLLFSVKSEDVYNQTVIQLLGIRDDRERNLINTDQDGKTFKSERKVILSVRSTLESVFAKLGMSDGDSLSVNDFKYYFQALINKMTIGNLKLYKISSKLSERGGISSLPEKDKLIVGDWGMDTVDFEDGMARIKEMETQFASTNIGIPLSPIDFLIQKINATPRPSWNKYGDGNPFFKVDEITGRNYMLVPNEVGGFVLVKNDKQQNVESSFQNFNNGSTDVLLLNTSGSTGASAHSKYDFKDRRPRAMIIHQPELDVNVEVQKRGRIFRTGQVNFPTYIYLVSRIPSEIRRLIMLRHKLKSLDANTTANQEQSARLSDIQSASGGAIEDFNNVYGLEILEEFLMDGSHMSYQRFIGNLFREGETDDDGRTVPEWMKLSVDKYLKNIQLALSVEQKYFYEVMNERYIIKKQILQDNNEWDLETDTEDMKAVLKTRITKEKGDGRTFFGEAVYEEDDYIMKELRPLSKLEVKEFVDKLLDGVSPTDYIKKLKNDISYYFENDHIPKVLATFKKPVREDFVTDLDFEDGKRAYQVKIDTKKATERNELKDLLEIISYFTPNKPMRIPTDISDYGDSNISMESSRGLSTYNLGRFIGYKIRGEEGKFSRGNIEMVFAQLKNQPKVIFKPTNKYIDALYDMMVVPPNAVELMQIDNWLIDTDKRDIARLITGNILSGYQIAHNMVINDPQKWKSARFTRFTTFEGNMLRVGIRLVKADPYANLELNPDNAVIITPINSEDVREKVKTIGVNLTIENDQSNVYFQNLGDMVVDGVTKKLIKFVVVAGRLMGNGNGVSPRSPIKISPLFDDYTFLHLLPNYPLDNMTVLKRHRWQHGANWVEQEISLMVRQIVFEDTDEGWANIQPYLDYAYERLKIKIELRGMSGEDVFDREDVSQFTESETVTDVSLDTGREYKYYPIIPFNPTNKPSEFLRYEENEFNPYGYGVIYVSQALKPITGMSYNIIPADLSIPQMWSFYMAQLDETLQRDVVKNVEAMILEGKNDVLIGAYALKQLSTGIDKFVFGKMSVFQIGEIFRSYLSGEFNAEISEVAQQPLTREEQEIVEEYEEVAQVPMSWGSVQDFLILLSHKL